MVLLDLFDMGSEIFPLLSYCFSDALGIVFIFHDTEALTGDADTYY